MSKKKTSIHEMGIAPLLKILKQSGKTHQEAMAIMLQHVGKKFYLEEVLSKDVISSD